MRLVSVGIAGYARFAEATELKVDGKAIALVGPNEAGKTSLLRALTRIGQGGGFERTELTRGREVGSEHRRIVWARYAIENDDRDAIGEVHGLAQARWYVEWKAANGQNYHRIEPADALVRDLAPRRSAVSELRRAAAHKLVRQRRQDADEASQLEVAIASLIEALESDEQTLDEAIVEQVKTVGRLWPTDLPATAPKYLFSMEDRLANLAEVEAAAHPNGVALSALDPRGAQFLLFGEEERNLQSDYDLTTVADSDRTPVVGPGRVRVVGCCS